MMVGFTNFWRGKWGAGFGVCEWGKWCEVLMLNFYSKYTEYYEYLLTFIHPPNLLAPQKVY